MPQDERWSDSEWDSADWDDEEGDSPDDQTATTDCIKCGCEIYDDASCCPICGEYQVGDRALTAWEGRPLWWKVGGILGILAVLFGLVVVCF